MSIPVGLKGRAQAVVTDHNTASAMGSGLVEVFATPAMIALMEQAAVNALASSLAPGEATVGTRLEVSHDAATPVGLAVWAQAELTQVEGRRLTFAVDAFDEAGPIGGGLHERCLISVDRFLDKAGRRKGGADHVH